MYLVEWYDYSANNYFDKHKTVKMSEQEKNTFIYNVEHYFFDVDVVRCIKIDK